mmetsp:Transcript_1069/g.3294  ORF Transcript_1069/g.3294 Transcript_1069/m.3294 type:complete len:267 (+) Transcript_1069:2874-3674(+)
MACLLVLLGDDDRCPAMIFFSVHQRWFLRVYLPQAQEPAFHVSQKAYTTRNARVQGAGRLSVDRNGYPGRYRYRIGAFCFVDVEPQLEVGSAEGQGCTRQSLSLCPSSERRRGNSHRGRGGAPDPSGVHTLFGVFRLWPVVVGRIAPEEPPDRERPREYGLVPEKTLRFSRHGERWYRHHSVRLRGQLDGSNRPNGCWVPPKSPTDCSCGNARHLRRAHAARRGTVRAHRGGRYHQRGRNRLKIDGSRVVEIGSEDPDRGETIMQG